MPSIRDLLDRYRDLKPLPTGLAPRLHRAEPRPRAVLFDLYGTLLISASGDIDKVKLPVDELPAAAREFELPFPSEPGFFAELPERYRREVVTAREKLLPQSESRYPEVDILEVWTTLWRQWVAEGAVPAMPSSEELKRAALVFEICTNPVAPMPGMRDLIPELQRAGCQLGIISNAQFYTPIICRYFLSGKWDGLSLLREWFNPLLNFFSYRERRSKPEPELFQEMVENLGQYGIAPAEALLVGNDLQKDLRPAKAAGMATVLFAGDARSLRLYGEDPAAVATEVDYQLTELSQLKELCGL